MALRVLIIALGVALASCQRTTETDEGPVSFAEKEVREIRKLSPLPELPPSPTNTVADDPVAVHLGQQLFYDTRLSAKGAVACATCHDPEKSFSDGRPVSEGISKLDRHSQGLWNVGHQRWFFWDGRADSLWAQALQPLLDEREMGGSVEQIRKVVTEDPALNTDYEKLFGEAGTHSPDRFFSNVGKSFEAYQRLFVSKDSAFDRFVEDLDNVQPGDDKHLSESARRGLRIFVGRGQCILCHAGPNFSDGEFHNIGLPRHPELPRDSGRFAGIRKLEEDRFKGTGEFSDDRSEKTNIKTRYLVVKVNNLGEFKTPSLRNVAESAPYMHDGRFATLREVLDFYSELPDKPPLGHREETLRPLKFTEQEKDDVEAFLRSLTGAPLDKALLRPPEHDS